jgi:hypothetical protein
MKNDDRHVDIDDKENCLANVPSLKENRKMYKTNYLMKKHDALKELIRKVDEGVYQGTVSAMGNINVNRGTGNTDDRLNKLKKITGIKIQEKKLGKGRKFGKKDLEKIDTDLKKSEILLQALNGYFKSFFDETIKKWYTYIE